MNTKTATTYCTGSGTAPSAAATEAARARYADADPELIPDPLFGRKGCATCGRVYFPKADGTLPKHKA